MINEETVKQLIEMKFYGMAGAFKEHLDSHETDALTFEERFGMMVDREWNERQSRKLKNRLSRSKIREQACMEDIDYRHPRGLDRSVMQRLATCQWTKKHENILVTGATGLGKTWLACALAHQACRDGHTIFYTRVSRILQELFVARGSGTYGKLMERLAKPDVVILDDFGLSKLGDLERRDLLEIVEDRQDRKSTIITSQLEVKHWHEVIGEPTIADAILDRLVNSSHRIDMKGKRSMREGKKDKKQ